MKNFIYNLAFGLALTLTFGANASSGVFGLGQGDDCQVEKETGKPSVECMRRSCSAAKASALGDARNTCFGLGGQPGEIRNQTIDSKAVYLGAFGPSVIGFQYRACIATVEIDCEE